MSRKTSQDKSRQKLKLPIHKTKIKTRDKHSWFHTPHTKRPLLSASGTLIASRSSNKLPQPPWACGQRVLFPFLPMMSKDRQTRLVALHDVAEGNDGRPDAALGPCRRPVRRPQPLQPLLLLHLELEGFQPLLGDLLDRGARLLIGVNDATPPCARYLTILE